MLAVRRSFRLQWIVYFHDQLPDSQHHQLPASKHRPWFRELANHRDDHSHDEQFHLRGPRRHEQPAKVLPPLVGTVKLNTDFKNQKNNQTTCIRPEVLGTNVVPAPLNTRQTSMAFFMKNILSVIAMAVVLCLPALLPRPTGLRLSPTRRRAIRSSSWTITRRTALAFPVSGGCPIHDGLQRKL